MSEQAGEKQEPWEGDISNISLTIIRVWQFNKEEKVNNFTR
jgi:hypothetical protein